MSDGGWPTWPAADLHVLLGERAQDVGRGEAARGHAQRVEPQAHGIFALAEILHVGDAGDALQRVAHVEINIVAEKQAVVLAVFGIDACAENEIA